MGFKDLFHKKNTNSDCCSVEIVADDDTDTTSDQEEEHPQAQSYPATLLVSTSMSGFRPTTLMISSGINDPARVRAGSLMV